MLKPIRAGMESPVAKFSDPLKILMVVVGIVLLIACANLANLLLARAAARRKEIAVRLAIGAGRVRILRQLLTESMALAALGTVGGALFAWWGSRFLLRAASSGPATLPLDISPDGRVFAFTLGVALLTALLFGLAPAFRAVSTDPQVAIRANAGSGARGGTKFGKTLVVAQVALSLLLLVGAGLFLRSLSKLEGVDAGFRRDHLLLFGLNPGRAGYKSTALRTLYDDLLAELGALPGVRSASISAQSPLDGGWGNAIRVPGRVPSSNEEKFISRDSFTSGYLATMGATLLRGRDFTGRDDDKAPRVAILNELAARTYFGNQNPIGKRIGLSLDGPADIEVVGVVKDMKYRGLRNATERVVYTPLAQVSSAGISVEVRTQSDPLTIAPLVRSAVGELIHDRPVERFQTMTVVVENQLMPERLVATLSGFFGALAALLAAIGLYGLTAYAVAQRTGEIGIRMALGAQRAAVQLQVMRETMMLVFAGALAGLGVTLITSRVAVSLLYGVSPTDPLVITAAIGVLGAAAFLAGWVPARRASRVDPMVALRYE
jgi:predicted permease